MSSIKHTFHESPLGKLLLRRDGQILTGLWFADEAHPPEPGADWHWDDYGFDQVRRELDAYFAGTLQVFTVPVNAPAGTAFQREVWKELTRIPYGTTISYGEQARRLGKPAAVRAIGSANGKNPVSIIIPCHRVIGANGSLTGYGGGLPAKRWLLEHEAAYDGSQKL
jgi:methylated-DNA-[protein]-cysteine S-methyltransferase